MPRTRKTEATPGPRKKLNLGTEAAPRKMGRPAAPEPYERVTVTLFDRHVLWLDKLALSIREKTGKKVHRAELIRAFVDHATNWVCPDRPDFEQNIRSLLIEKGVKNETST